MNLTLLQTGAARTLGWALIHFLWEGAAVAALVKVALTALARSSGRTRHVVACCGLGVLFACPVLTFLVLPHPLASPNNYLAADASTPVSADKNPVRPGDTKQVIRITAQRHSRLAEAPGWVEARLPWVLLAWSAGVLMLSARLAGGWWRVRRLTERGLPLDEAAWQERLACAVEKIGVTQPIKLLRSAFVQVPTVVGWLRPIVLLPMTSLTGLAPAELEALLAHEVAHVRRQDYLVNLLQSAVETLLFYHPAVWWISGQIRIEREHACDDLVVAAYADRLTYARALANLEERRGAAQHVFALSADGASLLQRIRRLTGEPAENRTSAGWMIGMAVPVGFACVLLALRGAPVSQASSRQGEQSIGNAGTSSTELNPAGVRKPDSAGGQRVQPDKRELATAGQNLLAPSATQQLFTRSYKVDPKTFLAGIRALRPETQESQNPGAADEGVKGIGARVDFPGVSGLGGVDTNTKFDLVRDYFHANGFDTSTSPLEVSPTNAAQKALFFNEQTGVLLVRGTREELDRVEKAIEAANVGLARVSIEIKFTELEQREINDLGLRPSMVGRQPGPNPPALTIQVTNRTGHVSPPGRDEKNKGVGLLFENPGLRNVEQVSPGAAWTISSERFRAVMQALERKAGADVLAAPRVTTLSGRQARIEVIEIKSIVTGVSISTDAQSHSSANYIPTALPTGPAVDVVPYVAADGKTIRLLVIPSWTEFLGYDDPGPFVPQATFDGNKLSPPLQVQRPLPAFRAVQTVADVTVRDGETIVITGLGSLQSHGKNPKGGKSSTTASGSGRQLVVFISPTIVDPAGNRVHPQ